MSDTPAGWYTDPDDRDSFRYWDGSAWTGDRAPRYRQTQGSAPAADVSAPPTTKGREWRSRRGRVSAGVGVVTVVAVAIGLVLQPWASDDEGYGVVEVPSLGGDFAWAQDVSESGLVVGFSTTGGNVRIDSYIHDPATGMTDAIQSPARGPIWAWAVNDAGWVVGGYQVGDRIRAFRYSRQRAVFDDLGTLGGGFAVARAVNNEGVVVGLSERADGDVHAFRWDPADAAMTDLGTIGGSMSAAYDINDDGVVVGESSPPGEVQAHATVWGADGKARDLGTLGGPWSAARSINGDGVIVGESSRGAGEAGYVAFVVDDPEGVMEQLRGDDRSPRYESAHGINDAGVVVGQVESVDAEDPAVFVFDRRAGETVHAAVTGIDSGLAINDDGWIAGVVAGPGGALRGTLARPGGSGTTSGFAVPPILPWIVPVAGVGLVAWFLADRRRRTVALTCMLMAGSLATADAAGAQSGPCDCAEQESRLAQASEWQDYATKLQERYVTGPEGVSELQWFDDAVTRAESDYARVTADHRLALDALENLHIASAREERQLAETLGEIVLDGVSFTGVPTGELDAAGIGLWTANVAMGEVPELEAIGEWAASAVTPDGSITENVAMGAGWAWYFLEEQIKAYNETSFSRWVLEKAGENVADVYLPDLYGVYSGTSEHARESWDAFRTGAVDTVGRLAQVVNIVDVVGGQYDLYVDRERTGQAIDDARERIDGFIEQYQVDDIDVTEPEFLAAIGYADTRSAATHAHDERVAYNDVLTQRVGEWSTELQMAQDAVDRCCVGDEGEPTGTEPPSTSTGEAPSPSADADVCDLLGSLAAVVNAVEREDENRFLAAYEQLRADEASLTARVSGGVLADVTTVGRAFDVYLAELRESGFDFDAALWVQDPRIGALDPSNSTEIMAAAVRLDEQGGCGLAWN